MHNEEMQVNMEALGGHCYFCSVAFSYDHEKKKKLTLSPISRKSFNRI